MYFLSIVIGNGKWDTSKTRFLYPSGVIFHFDDCGMRVDFIKSQDKLLKYQLFIEFYPTGFSAERCWKLSKKKRKLPVGFRNPRSPLVAVGRVVGSVCAGALVCSCTLWVCRGGEGHDMPTKWEEIFEQRWLEQNDVEQGWQTSKIFTVYILYSITLSPLSSLSLYNLFLRSLLPILIVLHVPLLWFWARQNSSLVKNHGSGL